MDVNSKSRTIGVRRRIHIGDGNKQLRAQNHHDSLSLAQRPMEMLIIDKEIAGIYLAGKTKPNKLSDVDNVRLQYFYFLALNAWEFSYYQNEDGTVAREMWIGQDGWMRGEIRASYTLKEAWGEMKDSFAEPFRSYANELMNETPKKNCLCQNQHSISS